MRIRLADDLREERSHSVSLSADLYHTFGKVQTNLLVEGFYTILDDVFALRDMDDAADGGKVKERYNGSGATVRGFNVEGRAAFTRWFELQAGVTLQQSRYKEPEFWSEDAEVPPVRRMFPRPMPTAISPRRSNRCGISRPTCREPAPGRCWCSTWPGRASGRTWPFRPRRSST